MPIIGSPWPAATVVEEGVLEVMDADVLQAGAGTDALPEWLKVAEAGARLRADDVPWVLRDTLDLLQRLHGGLPEVDRLGAGLGSKAERGDIHLLLLGRHNRA